MPSSRASGGFGPIPLISSSAATGQMRSGTSSWSTSTEPVGLLEIGAIFASSFWRDAIEHSGARSRRHSLIARATLVIATRSKSLSCFAGD